MEAPRHRALTPRGLIVAVDRFHLYHFTTPSSSSGAIIPLTPEKPVPTRSVKIPFPSAAGLMSVVPEQEDTRRRAPTGGDDRDAGVGDLPFAGFVAELGDAFVEEPETVRPAFRQLAAVRVDG